MCLNGTPFCLFLVGVTKDRGTIRYLVQLKDCLELEEVTACVAAKNIPTHVVTFLESKLEWFMPNEGGQIGPKLPQESVNLKGAPAKVYCNLSKYLFYLFFH